MKKLFLTLLSVIMLFSVTQAVTLTIVQPQGTVVMTRPVGSQIVFKDLTSQIKWWKVISGGVEIIDDGFTMPNNNVEVEAMYTGSIITVIQNAGGTISPGSVGVEENGSKTFTITPNSGYTVSDVVVDGSSVGVNTSYTFSNVTQDHTITATYTAIDYTITYNLDGGSVATANPTSYTVESSAITLNNPTKEGYTFTGWTGSNGETPETTVTIATGSTGNKSYTANWQINTYTITVTQGENGTITPGTTTVNYGSSQTFNIAPNSGYVLSGLIVDGNAVTASDTYTFENVTDNHTITATFDILQTYTVSYNGNGGTNVPTSQTKTHGVDLTITSEIPSRENYEFMGWGTSSNSTTIAYAPGSTYTANADLTLYAIWKAELADIASLGEYVEYIPTSTSYQTDTATTGHTDSQTFNPSTTTLWRIISNDGTNIKLISSDVINDTSSAGLSLKGNTGYTNAVTTLTNLAGAYVNTDYAVSGSYPTAITEITTAGVGLTTEYWLAATSGTSVITGYSVSYVNASGAVANALLYKKIISTTENTVAYAVRPEVTLKPNIVFIGGDGTIDNPYKLSATETVNKYTITVTQSSGGTISPDTIEVVNGSSKAFTITADEECAISKLIVDNVEQTITDNKVMTYTFNNVTENHTITAEYITLITKPTVAFVSKTTNSFTVTAVSTDRDGDNLTYKLYAGGTLKATSASTASGTQVTLEVSDLSEYTKYSYYVTATDGTDTSTSSTASVRTYCSGTTYRNCSGMSQGACSYCNNGRTDRHGEYPGSSFETYFNLDCENCGAQSPTLSGYFCPTCGVLQTYENGSTTAHSWYCGACDNYNPYYLEDCICQECSGTGEGTDYYCSSHGATLTSSSQSHCAHGKTAQHD